jgi:hypothetical protein
MRTKLPWADALLRRVKPFAKTTLRINSAQYLDRLALQAARDLRDGAPQMSGTTGTWTELMYANGADFTAFNTSASEGTLLSGVNEQPTIPSNFFFNKQGLRRSIIIEAQGVLGTTSTPTIIFQVRMSSTVGSATLSGASLGVTAAITTASGVTNQQWQLRLALVCTVVGQGTNNATLAGAGKVVSEGGFAAPYGYALEPTTPPTATWTQTFDASLQQYINLSVTWGTSSASNTITCKQLKMYGEN